MPTTSVPNNYTTSSGRIVKNPNNYPVSGTNALQTQKRVRFGAVTRSLISSSTSNSTISLNVGTSHHRDNAAPSNVLQNTENLSTVKVSGPTILPITTHDSENFLKVSMPVYAASESYTQYAIFITNTSSCLRKHGQIFQKN